MRWLLLAMVACSDAPTPNDVVECADGWTYNGDIPFEGKCERACEVMPIDEAVTCASVNPMFDEPAFCMRTFERKGERGCCLLISSPAPRTMRTFERKGERGCCLLISSPAPRTMRYFECE